jgi:FkbM family methyltransferase
VPREPIQKTSKWESLLCFYGATLPDHPAKRRTVLNLAHLLRKTWSVPRVAQRRGINFELDLNDAIPRSIFYLGYYEPWETRWLEGALEPGWTVLDVGAHIGYYSLLCAKGVGPAGSAYAFEPCASTFARLRRNIGLNPGLNIYPEAMAVADKSECVSMAGADNSNTGTSHIAGGDSGNSSVPVTTLDEFVEKRKITRVDFIKADVEGYEVKLLAGAEKTLARLKPRLMIEVNPDALVRFGAPAEDLIQTLRSRNYSLYEATWRGLRPFTRLPPSGKYTNVIALPETSAKER